MLKQLNSYTEREKAIKWQKKDEAKVKSNANNNNNNNIKRWQK